MKSNVGITVKVSSIKRLFIISHLNSKKSKSENLDKLLELLSQYQATNGESKKLCEWFFKCWNNGNWEY